MAQINQTAFKELVARHIDAPGGSLSNDDINGPLNPSNGYYGGMSAFGEGIHFGGYARLALHLLDRSYRGLEEEVNPMDFANRMSLAIQHFATGFLKGGELCYPHFLLHGLEQPSVAAVIDKLQENSRIIHETLNTRESYIKDGFPLDFRNGFKIHSDRGQGDDFFGICTMLAFETTYTVAAMEGYITKVSFMLDMSAREAYIVTIQGKAPPESEDEDQDNQYHRAAGMLQMNPRVYHLQRVSDLLRDQGFRVLHVIKPKNNVMTLEQHSGFHRNYLPIVQKAGINRDNGLYLSTEWFAG